MQKELSIFKVEEPETKLSLEPNGIGHYGFLISPKFDNKTVYFPTNASDHSTSMRFSLGKLFSEERNESFNEYKEKCKNVLNDEYRFYMDSNETAMACFIASLGSMVFLNTSTEFFKCGVLFMPESTDNEIVNNKINEVIEQLPNEKVSPTEIIIVPSLKETLENDRPFISKTLMEYIESQNSSLANN